MASIVTGAMSTLLPKLGNLLKEEYKLPKIVRGEIMFLKAEMESMEAALLEVSEAPIDQPPNKHVKLWATDARDMSYDLEDSIDRFMLSINTGNPSKPHSFKGFIDRSLHLLTKAKIRHKIGSNIKDIKSRIKNVTERRDRYKMDHVVAKPVGTKIDTFRLSALYKKETDLIGIEVKSNNLVKRLLEGDEAAKKQLKIISIVGFGGLGKTTLANVVYEKIKRQFDCGAFVSVSLNPILANIFKKMLHQLDGDKYRNINESTWSEAQLINELRKFLQHKRYLIVIDDIWNYAVWETIQHSLIGNECGSRIITTTRIHDVAKQVGGAYQLEPLSLDDSRKLFYLRVLGMEDKSLPNQLAQVSENILKKCGGVPLAIITIASMLASKMANKNTHKYWSMVHESMGSGLEGCPDVMNMRRVLSLSYYDLPPHLRTCLVYLSLYPEDYVIDIEDLIWKWVGEGFVCQESGKTFYEVGENYVNELIDKNLIQPVLRQCYFDDLKDNNKARFCHVHDMVLDLITYLSREDGFLTIFGGHQSTCLPNKIRRLSLQVIKEEDTTKDAATLMSDMRSLTGFDKSLYVFPTLSSFPMLRALDLRDSKQLDNHHLKDICNLFHLRYLQLCRTFITEIPKEIGNLQLLQVLEIDSDEIVELPPTILQLQQLVCLHIPYEIKLPKGLGNLKSLQELPGGVFIRYPSMFYDLSGLIKLRHIIIRFDEWDSSYLKPLFHCLSNLVCLESLVLICFHGTIDLECDNLSPGLEQLQTLDMSSCGFTQVPEWMSSLCSLSLLTIELSELGEWDLQVLGSIPSLSDLSLWVGGFREKRHKNKLVLDSFYPFLCLTKLVMSWSTHIIDVVFAPGAMQKLQTLMFKFGVREELNHFGGFDFGLENLSSLEDVAIEMWCYKANAEEVKAAEDAIRNALDMNPNKPQLEFNKVALGC